jgi:hypothetical protein
MTAPTDGGGGEAWRTDDCRAAGDWSEDAVEQLVHELSWELEEASLDARDYVTVNREKLRMIAKRVLARTPYPHNGEGEISVQQDRPHTAVDTTSCGHNSELEPDEQDQGNRNADRQGSEGGQGGRRAEVLPGGDECCERDVRCEDGGENLNGEGWRAESVRHLTPPAQVGAATDSGEELASSACPVCGLDEPHQHNSLEAMELRGRRFPITNDEWLRYVGRTIDPAMVNELDMLHKKAVRLATRARQSGAAK